MANIEGCIGTPVCGGALWGWASDARVGTLHAWQYQHIVLTHLAQKRPSLETNASRRCIVAGAASSRIVCFLV